MNATSSSNPLDSSAMLKLTSPVIAERRVLAVIVKLHSDLSHDFTPAERGEEVGLSDSQLRALFKKTMGDAAWALHQTGAPD